MRPRLVLSALAFASLCGALFGCGTKVPYEDEQADESELVSASPVRPKERWLDRGDPDKRVLVVVSAATTIRLLADERHAARDYVTGVFARELSEPLLVLAKEGYSFDFATPGGALPTWDINGLELPWFFWGDSEHFIGDRMIGDAIRSGRTRDEAVSVLMEAFGALKLSDKKTLSLLELPRAMKHWRTWEANEHLTPKKPKSLAEVAQNVTAAGAAERFPYVGLLVPGGHAPMSDLAFDADMASILRVFHEKKIPSALICHGPAALMSTTGKKNVDEWRAMSESERAAWPYHGYTLTVESTFEEHIMEKAFASGQKVEYYVDGELERAGAKLAPAQLVPGMRELVPGLAKVSADREVITGQSPASANCMGRVLHASIALSLRSPGEDWWQARAPVTCDGHSH